jgi:plasmid stabilization system protein ParE
LHQENRGIAAHLSSGEHGTRELVLRRFPYTIVYRVMNGVIVIVAIAHHSREKGYWQSRAF